MRKTFSNHKKQAPTPFLYHKQNLKQLINCRLRGVCWLMAFDTINISNMKRLLTSAAMLLCSLLTFAQFSGSGSGTKDDPYLILNPIQLNQVRNFVGQSDVYFKLMANIDLTEFIEDEYLDGGWLPIGSGNASFEGVFDGNGNTISGLTIDRKNTDYVGLFASIGYANIKNLKLKVNILGASKVGALAGYIKKGNTGRSRVNRMSNIIVEGTINGKDYVGGIIGGIYNACITNSIAKVIVNATGEYCGGITGYAGGGDAYSNIEQCKVVNSTITGNNKVGGISGSCGICGNCFFTGTISGVDKVGGIIGNAGRINNSFAIGDLFSGGCVGGIIGNSYNTSVEESYFSGNIFGAIGVGGVIGSNCDPGPGASGGYISKCYAIGNIRGKEAVGGLCGLHNSQQIINSVFGGQTISATRKDAGRIYGTGSGSVGGIGSTEENKAFNRTVIFESGTAIDIVDGGKNGTGSGRSTLNLKATYVAMGWDFTDTWEIQETECYPYFKTQTAPPVITSNVVSGATAISGKCVSGATIILEIDGVKQEMVSPSSTFLFTVDPLQAGHEVRISAKADGKEQSYFTTAVVSYLGSGTEADPYQISTAADLSYAYRKGYYKLMNNIDLTSYINQYSPTEGWESIGREGSETIYLDGDGHKVTGLWCNSTRDNTGLFSCFANGYIKNLTVETASGKQVKGGSNTGILIGKMINGTIENCRVSGNVADGTPVGGIVGLLDGGKILKSQASSVIINTTGDNTYVGGLVGDITSGEIDQCVTLGSITATGKNSQAGGLVGKNSATVTNCYSNAAVTSAYCAAGMVAYNMGLVEKCYATGNLSSHNYGAGVIGYNDGANAIIRNCVAMNQKIDVTYESQSAQSGGYGQRILGGYKNGAPDPGMNNYALKSMQLSVDEDPQKVSDDIMNGMAKKGSELMTASTYQSLGWDFTDVWNITAGESYPFLKNNVAEVKKYVKIAPAVKAPTALPNLIYNGEAQNLVTAGLTTSGYIYFSLDGTNYSRTIPTGINANSYVVYYKVIDDEDSSESNQGSTGVTISAKLLDNPTVTLSETSYIYDGTVKKPTVTVEDGGTTVPTTDYTLSYSNNTKVGTATVTIMTQTGKNYKFPDSGVSVNFDILREIANLFSGSNVWAGYVAQEDLALPTGLMAYVITSLGTSSATASQISYIPKDEPVVLKRDNTTTNQFLTSAGSGTVPTNNLLKVFSTDKTLSNSEGFVLYKDEFVLVDSGTLPAGRIFLPADGNGGAATRGIEIDGENTTSIENAMMNHDDSDGQWYDLQGRKLIQKPMKRGIYIKDGQKVVVK